MPRPPLKVELRVPRGGLGEKELMDYIRSTIGGDALSWRSIDRIGLAAEG